MSETKLSWTPLVCVVGFHHARGPEIESWYGTAPDVDPAVENDWSFLPFMALSDGAHASTEEFSYFTLRRKATDSRPATSLFGMSCSRQIDARELINRPDDVTRSTVQKSVVAIAESPHVFTAWREKLSSATQAWFLQKDFTNTKILKDFQEDLAENTVSLTESERDYYVGISLREFIHEFKHQALVLFKCCLLQPKMLFFGSRCERICMMQFALVSLIPGLIRRLEDCADPELDSYAKNVVKPTSLKTSDRASLLAYVGLPLQIFGKGSLFGPYTPLQQLDVLADHGTKSYIVGSTNSLLLQQKDRYSDVIINLDDSSVNISSPSLKQALSLTHADRRWIDLIYQDVAKNWDPENPSLPTDYGFKGSEDYIRILFEQYTIALLSAVKYHIFLEKSGSSGVLSDVEGDPSKEFGEAWVDMWMATSSYQLWSEITDAHLFDLVDPRHPTAGSFSVDDFNRRFAQQMQELNLDERFATSKEAISKGFATGQKKVSAAFNSVWADIEARRAKSKAENGDRPQTPNATIAAIKNKAPDMSAAQAAVGNAGQKAGAYFSSWGSWASEQRKNWGKQPQAPPPTESATTFGAEPSVIRPEEKAWSSEPRPSKEEEKAPEPEPKPKVSSEHEIWRADSIDV